MPSFTAGELRALLFLLALVALGTVVQLYQRLHPEAVPTYRIDFDSTTIQSVPAMQNAPQSKLQSGIDPNLAPAEDLELLPGVGPSLARAIVAYRQNHPKFVRAEDLLGVPGVGPRTLDRFRRHLTFP